MTACALTFFLMFYPVPGCFLADAGPVQPAGAAGPVAAYGRTDPHCAEWTDGCAVCLAGGGHAQCSTPGIACTPAGVTCTRPATP